MSRMACSPMSRAFLPNASPPAYQWTVIRSPATVRQSLVVSWYRIRSERLTTGSAPGAV